MQSGDRAPMNCLFGCVLMLCAGCHSIDVDPESDVYGFQTYQGTAFHCVGVEKWGVPIGAAVWEYVVPKALYDSSFSPRIYVTTTKQQYIINQPGTPSKVRKERGDAGVLADILDEGLHDHSKLYPTWVICFEPLIIAIGSTEIQGWDVPQPDTPLTLYDWAIGNRGDNYWLPGEWAYDFDISHICEIEPGTSDQRARLKWCRELPEPMTLGEVMAMRVGLEE